MKKYPFSKKAIQAMLAAAVALSPVVATGVVKPVQVEAETNGVKTADFSSEATLIAYLDQIYSNLGENDKKALKTASSKLTSTDEETGISNTQWLEYVKEMTGNSSLLETSDEFIFFKGLIQFVSGANLAGVGLSQINEFKTEYADEFKGAFGFSDNIHIQDFVDYLVVVETSYFEKLKEDEDTLSSKPEAYYFYTFYEALSENRAKNSAVADPFFDKINQIGTLSVLQKVTNEIDKDRLARAALVKAIKASAGITEGDGGGGGGATPTEPTEPTQPGNIELPEGSTETTTAPDGTVTTTIPASKVNDIVNLITPEKNVVPLKIEKPATGGDKAKAEVPAALFSEASKKNAAAIVEVQTEEATYKLPATEIKVEDLAKKLGVSASDVKINISINIVNAADVKDNVEKNNLKVASKVIEFTIEAVAGDKKQSIASFSTYVEREIVGDKAFNPKNQVAVILKADGTFSPVPTLFNGNKATGKSLTNSKYTIVENDVTFSDVNNNRDWAEQYIETLASKYIIKGKVDGTYAPKQQVTRAEFTALLVRALGLPGNKYDGRFKDVKGTEWFNNGNELMAAIEYGLIKGKADGKFAPGDKITRTEAAAIIGRALQMDFIDLDQLKINKTKKLTKFTDSKQIGNWAKSDVELVYQTGIMDGKTTTKFDPTGNTQRNEIAKILAKFLVTADLMNNVFDK